MDIWLEILTVAIKGVLLKFLPGVLQKSSQSHGSSQICCQDFSQKSSLGRGFLKKLFPGVLSADHPELRVLSNVFPGGPLRSPL